MKGYGLTVFAGATIEPFAVEVVSVMRDFTPLLSVIWIECPEPHMQHNGPVQGMSGSPIYLWRKGEAHDLGKGGGLIGAFAYGFSMVKTCYVGVQPIEQMRRVAQRAKDQPAEPQHALGSADLGRLLGTLRSAAASAGLGPQHTWRLQVLSDLYPPKTSRAPGPGLPPPPAEQTGLVMPMLLPFPVGSEQLGQVLRPLLNEVNLMPVAAGSLAGKPPPGLDPAAIRFEPGSVLSIPLLWGDLDLSASGTCTEVLPDGRVLGFGHAMFDQGPAALPMATGYVHLTLPRITTSFKLGGSAVVQPGAIVRDESAAVAGTVDGTFSSASMRVRVTTHEQPQRQYEYTLAHHRMLSPILAAIGAFQSIIAEQGLPIESSLRLSGELRFAGDRRLTLNSFLAGGSAMAVVFELLPPLATMANNPHEPVMVEQLDLSVQVEPVNRSAVLLHVRTDKLEYAPGDQVGLTVTYQPYRQPPQTKRIMMPLTDTLPDGQYAITVAAAQPYFQLLMQRRPHLAMSQNVDDVTDMLRRMLSVENDALYVVMELPRLGIAVGRNELPRLPSSRLALMATPTSPLVTPFIDWVQMKVPMDVAPLGKAAVRITVRKDLIRP